MASPVAPAGATESRAQVFVALLLRFTVSVGARDQMLWRTDVVQRARIQFDQGIERVIGFECGLRTGGVPAQ